MLLAKNFVANKNGKYPDVTGYHYSEKLDGVRAMYSAKQRKLFTRSHKRIHIPSFLEKELNEINVDLDGELYIGRNQFDKVNGIVRSALAGNVNEDNWKEIKFHVFDLPNEPDLVTAERIDKYNDLLKDGRFVVPVKQKVLKSNSEILGLLDKVEAINGEGLMLKQPDTLYVKRRSSSLLKVKSFFDEEAVVVSYYYKKGGSSGPIKGLRVKLRNGITFPLSNGLTTTQKKNPPAIGSVITYKYFEKTRMGVPRFASFLRIKE